MNEFLIAIAICFCFIGGFWLGVHWYKQRMIEDEKAARSK